MEFLCLEDAVLHIQEAISGVTGVETTEAVRTKQAQSRWSEAAGLLYAVIQNAQGPTPRWFELDRIIGHAIARDSVRVEGMEALRHASRWSWREAQIEQQQTRLQLPPEARRELVGDDAFLLDTFHSFAIRPGRWQPWQIMRVFDIGFEKQELFRFLGAHHIAFVIELETSARGRERSAQGLANSFEPETHPDSTREHSRYHISAGEIAFVFRDIKWDLAHWMANLQTPPQWLMAQRHSPGIRGNRPKQSRWYPLGIAIALASRAKGAQFESIRDALTRAFKSEALLEPNRQEWLDTVGDATSVRRHDKLTP